jgi:hypothetical protein
VWLGRARDNSTGSTDVFPHAMVFCANYFSIFCRPKFCSSSSTMMTPMYYWKTPRWWTIQKALKNINLCERILKGMYSKTVYNYKCLYTMWTAVTYVHVHLLNKVRLKWDFCEVASKPLSTPGKYPSQTFHVGGLCF